MFQPKDRTSTPPDIRLPDELWLTVLESQCTFPPEIFSKVMLNLIKNPNITSSHLFRADIFYDSNNNHSFASGNGLHQDGGLLKHLKPEYRPRRYNLPGFDLVRTIVRQLIPRNAQLDNPLLQTCHFFQQLEDAGVERNVIIYIPHIDNIEDMPFYHPSVSHLAFSHTWNSNNINNDPGSISISLSLFPSTTPTPKLQRTALHLLQTIHKHGQGQLAGYEKKVHHDQIIPQKRYQDTYARLKAKYGKRLSDQWVEVTDPGKHVFEDIGIAAFLIEVWRDMYKKPRDGEVASHVGGDENGDRIKQDFPGFVDIGCGNGILTNILLEEGYQGWGFDARERKTWSIFPSHVQQKLERRLLVPSIFQSNITESKSELWHDGLVPWGTFIISNHADELTAWTPLLAYLNNSSFIAIPCCSHDLSGARSRAPPSTKTEKQGNARLPQQNKTNDADHGSTRTVKQSQAAETGSLKRTEAQKKMPSAYSTLCSYVTSLAEEVGFEPEKEVLRIPSTRNQCIIGRRNRNSPQIAISENSTAKVQAVTEIVERELGRSIEAVGTEWVERAEKLAKKPGSGH